MAWTLCECAACLCWTVFVFLLDSGIEHRYDMCARREDEYEKYAVTYSLRLILLARFSGRSFRKFKNKKKRRRETRKNNNRTKEDERKVSRSRSSPETHNFFERILLCECAFWFSLACFFNEIFKWHFNLMGARKTRNCEHSPDASHSQHFGKRQKTSTLKLGCDFDSNKAFFVRSNDTIMRLSTWLGANRWRLIASNRRNKIYFLIKKISEMGSTRFCAKL